MKGKFVWQREEFRVRDFTQRVSDERYITTKPNYRNKSYEEGTAPWEVEIDSHGFRTGSNAVSEKGGNIAFIGDSVPFGYGVGGNDTVPSLLQDVLRQQRDPRGIINAALPSYSLDQAVHRYKYELAGRYHIEVVVLQIYDPASQFAQLGREWDVTKNWATAPVWERIVPILRYSSLWHIYYYYVPDVDVFKPDRLNVLDEAAIKKYVASINASLESLRIDTKDQAKKVLILPATLPPTTWLKISDPHRVALETLNQTLQDFSERHSDTEFIDTNALFASDQEGRGFIDECCHLSREGAARVASVLAAHLSPP
jgi:hypothetical protein